MLRLSNKKFFSFILLFLFLSVNKGFSFHHLTHECEEEQKECGLCEVVVQNEVSEIVVSPQFQIRAVQDIAFSIEIPFKERPIVYIKIDSYKSRPPPATT